MGLKNFWLKARLKCRSWKAGGRLITQGDMLYPVSGGDVYTNFKHGMPWGFVHPDNPWVGIGYNGIGVSEYGGNLILSVERFHGTIASGGITYTPGVVGGCVYTKEQFKYGKFEMEFVIPRNGRTLPAFWLLGIDSWPPEWDILEYFKDTDRGRRKRLSTNIFHLDMTDKSRSFRVGKVGEVCRIGGVWDKDGVSWYYNGLKFREEKYKVDQPMYLVVNLNIAENYTDTDLEDKLIVKNIKYSEL